MQPYHPIPSPLRPALQIITNMSVSLHRPAALHLLPVQGLCGSMASLLRLWPDRLFVQGPMRCLPLSRPAQGLPHFLTSGTFLPMEAVLSQRFLTQPFLPIPFLPLTILMTITS